MNDNLEHIIRNKISNEYVTEFLSRFENDVNIKNDVYDIVVQDICNNVQDIYMFFDDIKARVRTYKKLYEEYKLKLQENNLHTIDYLLDLHGNEINRINAIVCDLFTRFLTLLNDGTKNNDFEDKLFDYYSFYRYMLSLFASLADRFEWQSIAYDSSKRSQFFLSNEYEYKGILGYKRVHYPNLIEFENSFVNEFVENNNKDIELICLMTSSGQGAFLTIKEMISSLLPDTPVALLSRNSYYETRVLITDSKSWTCVFFNKEEEISIIEQIICVQPDVLIIEPYYCCDFISLVDVHKLLVLLNNIVLQKKLYVIIDASMMSGAIQPYKVNLNNSQIEVLLFESMVKYREFGLDKVNAGFVIAPKKYLRRLISSRAITGTILNNTELSMLPHIKKSLFDIRMKTVFRNAQYVSKEIQDFVGTHKHLLISGIEFPALAQHRHYEKYKASDYPYLNGIINIKFDNDYYKNFATMLFFITKTIESAKSYGLSIAHGTSFGFDYTRLAVADTSGGDFTQPFIRISIGRENYKDIVLLTEILKSNILKYLKY